VGHRRYVHRGDLCAGGDIERGKQAGDPVTGVIVGAPLQLADPHGQHRLGPAQSLNLGLLIHAKHQSVMRRIEIESDNIPHLVDQQRIAGKLKAFPAMRLIVDWLNPVLAASMRLDQWVAPFGVFSRVNRTTRSIFSSPISRGVSVVFWPSCLLAVMGSSSICGSKWPRRGSDGSRCGAG